MAQTLKDILFLIKYSLIMSNKPYFISIKYTLSIFTKGQYLHASMSVILLSPKLYTVCLIGKKFGEVISIC